MASTLIISANAVQNGYGAGMHRVLGLTEDEQQLAMAGERVFYRAASASRKGQTGTFWRVVKADGRQMYPRVPTLEEIATLRTETGVV